MYLSSFFKAWKYSVPLLPISARVRARTHMHAHTCRHMHTHVHTRAHTCAHTHMCMHMHTRTPSRPCSLDRNEEKGAHGPAAPSPRATGLRWDSQPPNGDAPQTWFWPCVFFHVQEASQARMEWRMRNKGSKRNGRGYVGAQQPPNVRLEWGSLGRCRDLPGQGWGTCEVPGCRWHFPANAGQDDQGAVVFRVNSLEKAPTWSFLKTQLLEARGLFVLFFLSH